MSSALSDASSTSDTMKQELENLTKAVNVINRLALSVTLDINATMESVRSVALELLDCERVTLFLVFERRKELRAEVPDGGKNAFIRVKFGEGIAGMTATNGELLNIPDAYQHPLFSDKHDKQTGFKTRSMLSCAIPDSGGKPVAVLQALNKLSGTGSFNASDEKNLQLFGAHLGNALVKARLHEQAKREKDRLSAIFNYFKLISTANDLGEVLGVCTDALQSILHAEHAFVFIMDAPRNELWMQCRPPGQEELLSVRVKVGDGLVGQCGLETASPINVCDYDGGDELISLVLDPLLRGGRRTSSALIHPVYGNSRGKGKVTAVILALNKRPYAPSSSPRASRAHAEQRSPFHNLNGHDDGDDNDEESGIKAGPDMFFEDYYTEADAEALALIAMEVGDALSARSLECAYASALSVISDVDGIAPGHPVAMMTPPVSSFEPLEPPRVASFIQMHAHRQGLFQADSNTVSSSSRDSLGRRETSYETGDYSPFLASQRTSCTDGHDQGDVRTLLGLGGQVGNHSSGGTLEMEEGGGGVSGGHSSGQVHAAPASSSHRQDNGWKLRSQLMSMYSQSVLLPSVEPTTKAFRTSKTLGRKQTRAVPGEHTGGGGPMRASMDVQRMHQSDRDFNHSDGGRDGADAEPASGRGDGQAAYHRSSDYSQLKDRGGAGVSDTLASKLLDMNVSVKPGGREGDSSSLLPGSDGQSPSKRKAASGPLPMFTLPGQHPNYAIGDAASSYLNQSLGMKLENLQEEPEESGYSLGTMPSLLPPQLNGDQGDRPSRSLSVVDPLGLRPQFTGPGYKVSRSVSIHRGASSVFTFSGLDRPSSSSALPPTEPGPEGSRSEPGSSGGVDYGRSSWPSGLGEGASQGIPCFFGREVLHSWDYDLTGSEMSEMKKICYDLFILSGLIDHFKINIKALTHLIEAVASHYRFIPYHNFNHIVHVLHSTWMMLQAPTAQALLRKEDQLALMLAAICHDLDHDGHSNSFHVYTQSELARLYNDASVMENHHCALAFEILRRQECAVLSDFDRESWRRIRKTIVAAILCTDMSNHTHVTQDFRKHDVTFDPESEADRLLLVKVMLHAADIGNAVRPFDINDIMSKRVHREFQVLAAEEDKLGVPITFSIDSSNALMCAQMEVNFLDYVVSPLWERLTEVVPELKPALENLLGNRKAYHKLAHEAMEAASKGHTH